VQLGRPGLWALAVDGEAGVRHGLDLLRTEMDLALALCGCRNIAKITRDLIA
jgi:isopentenyl diphosphate isomerase/L-lactate dehydrogenase-like FMN-dependent dehydrogenase